MREGRIVYDLSSENHGVWCEIPVIENRNLICCGHLNQHRHWMNRARNSLMRFLAEFAVLRPSKSDFHRCHGGQQDVTSSQGIPPLFTLWLWYVRQGHFRNVTMAPTYVVLQLSPTLWLMSREPTPIKVIIGVYGSHNYIIRRPI